MMTSADRRKYILQATCKGCSADWPTQSGRHIPMPQGRSDIVIFPCTANHVLADEVEKWIAVELELFRERQ